MCFQFGAIISRIAITILNTCFQVSISVRCKTVSCNAVAYVTLISFVLCASRYLPKLRLYQNCIKALVIPHPHQTWCYMIFHFHEFKNRIQPLRLCGNEWDIIKFIATVLILRILVFANDLGRYCITSQTLLTVDGTTALFITNSCQKCLSCNWNCIFCKRPS